MGTRVINSPIEGGSGAGPGPRALPRSPGLPFSPARGNGSPLARSSHRSGGPAVVKLAADKSSELV